MMTKGRKITDELEVQGQILGWLNAEIKSRSGLGLERAQVPLPPFVKYSDTNRIRSPSRVYPGSLIPLGAELALITFPSKCTAISTHVGVGKSYNRKRKGGSGPEPAKSLYSLGAEQALIKFPSKCTAISTHVGVGKSYNRKRRRPKLCTNLRTRLTFPFWHNTC
jgi:hypothetical protein